MDQKIIRFLNSIKIENINDFDMSFDLCARNILNNKEWDMVILKNTPWQYHLLEQFINALSNITYSYNLSFSYLKQPNIYDAMSLFEEWYQTLYHLPSPYTLKSNGDTITLTYTDKNLEQETFMVCKDFKSLLNFIFYNFNIAIEYEEVNENVIQISKRKLNNINKKAEEEAKEAIEEIASKEESVDIHSSQIEESKDEIKEDVQKKVEDALLAAMRENAAKMKKDREMQRRNKRGNYQIIDCIDQIDSNSNNVDFIATIFSIESRAYDGRVKLTIGLNDEFNGAIYAIFNNNPSLNSEKIAQLTKGLNVRVRGCAYIDEFNKQLSIKGHYIDPLPPEEIECDKAPIKRVELHLHTQMSSMDAPGNINDYCKLAKAYGMKAIAITDHEVVSGFPLAQKAGSKSGIKVLYGSELYVVEDKLEYIKNPSEIELNRANYVVFDLETTGLSCRYDRIIEFGAVRIERGVEVGRLDILINPKIDIPKHITRITKITNEMVKNQPTFNDVKDKIKNFLKDAILVTHNADFDISFLNEALVNHGDEALNNPVIDTLSLSRNLFPTSRNHRLGTLCRLFEVKYDEDVAHRADYDAEVLNDVWQAMLAKLTKTNKKLKHLELMNLPASSEMLKHIHPFHVTVLAKNEVGLHNLYRLVSKAHIDYLAEVPKVPRSEINNLREGLLIGSACFNGEIFEIASHKNLNSLKNAMAFYDYIEVQPLPNYIYLVNKGNFSSLDDIKKIIIDIVKTADSVNKLVVATGDVHYAYKKEKIFRDVYISAKGIGGVPHPLNLNPYNKKDIPNYDSPDQHFRSTDEMLEEMAFLGEEKAYEVTVTNTNLIADSIDNIIPLPNNKLFTPTIDNVENKLRDLCYGNAKKLYGDPIPDPIKKRLDVELDGIISNGYSVIYFIAHQLVKKANDDGYLVGSRGSVGSSFVATMSEVTEVNPLPPHYICPSCHKLEWTSEIYPDIKSGYDLPSKKCPLCGHEMIHDGQNIPFETFLGFKAEKTPDIDLNFPGDYQARAHDYTKELLGEQNVFRAGTIESVKDQTAFGYARGYFERLGIDPDSVSKAKIAYVASGCVGVRRTTGQHPGGIVVVPKEYSVFDFIPIQYPANKEDSTWKTTHFDFHSFDNTLLKLDLLGHVDPVALKMMADITNIDIKSIPMNDVRVLSLFSSVDALGMKSNYLNQKNGALAIPEYGTDFVRGMLESTNPKTFSDLVIISGLSHGTNVWNGNAEKLIQDKVTDLRGVIGCRDDIMTYLISKGVAPSVSFAIMEDVRKGRKVKPEYEKAMLANNVPQYYIDSCNKIEYMFPKGHATAYVMMAIRVGYFKVYYPLEFYAVFFSVRSDQWDISAMIKGEKAIIERYEELRAKSRSKFEKLSPKEEEIIKTLTVAIEMVQRGYKFDNLDLYKSDATKFIVNHENKSLIPPFIVVDGLGENAANSVIEARKDGEFISKEDLLRRTKLNGTNIKDLSALGVLDSLNETDQLSLFDFDF